MSYINVERDGEKVKVWTREGSERKLEYYNSPYYFYVQDKNGKHTSLFGDKCTRVDCKDSNEFFYAKGEFERRRYKLFESDIQPEFKVLAKHFFDKPAPDLRISFLDIETDYDKTVGFSSPRNPYAPISSVAIMHQWSKEIVVFAVPPKSWKDKNWTDSLDPTLHDLARVELFETEHDLLMHMVDEIQQSDALVGWNSNFFDIPYIGKRVEQVIGKTYFNKLSFGGGRSPQYREVEVFGNPQLSLHLAGRLNVDYLDLFKKFEQDGRASYKLDNISEEVLPEMKKLEYEGSLADLYSNDFNYFLRYNIRDVECLNGFEEKLGYVALANEMYHSSTGLYANILGTIKLAELSIINFCHNELDVVVPNMKEHATSAVRAQGAFVLKPKGGFHRWIGSIDIASLYPSSIRSINISPETLIGQFVKNVEAFDAIHAKTEDDLTFTFEDGTQRVLSAIEWRDWLTENNCAVSGYGTVFTQDKKGVIPSILESWYSTRKEYKALCGEAKAAGDEQKAAYYDRLQYCYKIKLNSLYGALLNNYFRFYDPRMGESTTGTGRAILRYMCGKTNEILTDKFDPIGEAVVYGDTDSCYFNTFTDNKEDAIRVADALADSVNQSFNAFMKEAFLCSDGFDDIISAEREVVASAGIFVTPKRYVLKLVNLDGEDVDKLKSMGLDIKRTTIPKFISKKLSGYISRYLDGEEWETIAYDVVNFKEELMLTDDVTLLGLPKGVKGVEKYTTEYEMDPNCRIPGHVRASILYNQKLNEFNDHESFPIVSDMKIRVYYLRCPDGKFKSIALPTDLDNIPDWFLQAVEVDRLQQVKRLIDNPLENILKAVGKVSPSKQSLFFDEVFTF